MGLELSSLQAPAVAAEPESMIRTVNRIADNAAASEVGAEMRAARGDGMRFAALAAKDDDALAAQLDRRSGTCR
jgi:hypothetical protein